MSRLPLELYFDEYSSNQSKAFENLSIELKEEVTLFRNYFDFQQKLFLNHYPGPTYYFDEHETIILQCYWKSTHLLFSVNELILHGDYGSARVLIRQIFEYLVLGKYMNIVKDNQIAKNWLNGRQFDVYDKIIRLLKTPDKKYFHDLWITQSKLVHAGTSSIQIGLAKNIDDEVIQSYGLNMVLLCCKNHFLQKSYISGKLVYISDRYGKHKEENIGLRKQLRYLESKIKRMLTDRGKMFIKDYKQAWEFKK